MKEGPFDIEVLEPGQHEPIVYRSYASIKKEAEGAGEGAATMMDRRVKDVFVTGEVRLYPSISIFGFSFFSFYSSPFATCLGMT